MSRLLLLSLLLLAPAALAQNGAVPSMEADQSEYAYGETIELRYSITNEGDEPFTLFGASEGCQAEFVFDSFDSRFDYGLCTADERPYVFAPGETGTWVWQVRPGSLGLPEFTGTHEITGYWRWNPDHLPATVSFVAPQYFGGRIWFALAPAVTEEDIQDVLDELNAIEVEIEFFGTAWEISGTTLDEAVARYGDDPRFTRFEPFRVAEYSNVFFTDDEDDAPPQTDPALTAAHPNPFAVSTSFALTVPQSGPTRVEVFDVLGRRVAVLHDGPLAAGPEHHFTLHAAALPSGLYVVRASGEGFTQTRRVTLSR
jgi:hypothetical protein